VLAIASEIASAPRPAWSSPAAATFDSGPRAFASARRAPATSPARRDRSNSLPTPSKSNVPLDERKNARSTITATDSTDRAMRSQSTHSEPRRVKLKIRWKACLKDLKLPAKIMPRNVSTQWNLPYDMLGFTIEYREPIEVSHRIIRTICGSSSWVRKSGSLWSKCTTR